MVLLAIGSIAMGVLLSVGMRALLRRLNPEPAMPAAAVGLQITETDLPTIESVLQNTETALPATASPRRTAEMALPATEPALSTEASQDQHDRVTAAEPDRLSPGSTGAGRKASGEMDTETSVPQEPENDTERQLVTATDTHILYRVRPGDTLWSIAAALTGNPYDCWILWPERTPHGEDLEIGTVLEIPLTALTVAPGPDRN